MRGWTDEQLRAAVAGHKSWRDVARALGLRPTSTHNLRRHVARLRLDTSHFIGRRLWTDDDLAAAVAQASSWTGVLRQLNIRQTSAARVRVKGHAARLGLDVSHFTKPPSQDAPALAHRPPMRKMLRTAAASIATAWFLLRGYPTAVPSEPQEYDLLVTLPEGIRRVQVKSTTSQTAHGRWLVRVGHRPYSLDKSASSAPYDPDTLDYFFVVVGEGSLYLVPSHIFAGRTAVYIDGYARYRVGAAASLLDWAD